MGREIDKLVAGKVFGAPDGWVSSYYPNLKYFPEFSSKIEEAWQVVEELRNRGIYLCIEACPNKYYGCTKDSPTATFSKESDIWGETAPEVICKLALKAVGADLREGGV